MKVATVKESVFVPVVAAEGRDTIPQEIGGSDMKRDMDVIRKIMLAVQARTDIDPRLLKVDGLDDFTVGYHVALLHDVGLIVGPSTQTYDTPYKQVLVKDLSWEGHDFVAAMANDTVWGKLKQSLSPSDLASLPLKIIKDVGTGILEQWVKTQIGL
ncbi:DUF2513 domain-containing protein [Devosia sp. SL43]|uniref:DUF2513 domain-containing protein n=1 Tax=Devosia sp. SL43 TaxID=2806348 RepID=UPI001F482939|nr:DUF2513 domain-containing protein [Devosia sp. SL43]UJW87958.1 DUF2513 domain-containing protein [Devosia sp. SL43]